MTRLTDQVIEMEGGYFRMVEIADIYWEYDVGYIEITKKEYHRIKARQAEERLRNMFIKRTDIMEIDRIREKAEKYDKIREFLKSL